MSKLNKTLEEAMSYLQLDDGEKISFVARWPRVLGAFIFNG